MRPGRLVRRAAAVADVDAAISTSPEEKPVLLQPVDKVISARVVFDKQGEASVEYLTKWKVRLQRCRCPLHRESSGDPETCE